MFWLSLKYVNIKILESHDSKDLKWIMEKYQNIMQGVSVLKTLK